MNSPRFARSLLAVAAALLLLAPLPAGSQSTPVAVDWTTPVSGTTDVQLLAARAPTAAVPGRNRQLVCVEAAEKADADATIDLYHGTSAAGRKIGPTLTLNAGESTLKCYPQDRGPLVPNGVFAVRSSTNTEISLKYRNY